MVPLGGKFKNANLFNLLAAFGSIILKDLYLHMIENENLHILSLSSLLSVSTHQISNLMVLNFPPGGTKLFEQKWPSFLTPSGQALLGRKVSLTARGLVRRRVVNVLELQ